MQHSRENGLQATLPSIAMLAALISLTTALSLGAAVFFDRPFLHQSLFTLSNFVGPTTRSLLSGSGLTVCTEEMGTPNDPICFHAARMPLPSLVIGLGIRAFGDSFLRVASFKTILLLVPVELSIWLVWYLLPSSRLRRYAIAGLLASPFGMPIFLANVVNLQVEEAYAYSLLSFAVAMLLFAVTDKEVTDKRALQAPPAAAWLGKDSPSAVLLFAFTVDALYLTKSSLILAVAVLTVAFLVQQRRWTSRVLLLLLVAAAPAGWALYQHHASGRYTLGTSLDGLNLHKANVATFLQRYPPQPGSSLDQYDAELSRGVSFPDEWSFNDFHRGAAIAFMRTHPAETLRGDWRKFYLLFFSLTKYGSSSSRGLQLALETAGLLLFHAIFWIAVLGSVVILVRPTSANLRANAATFLALVVACVLPYMVGFAYTRHGGVLVYPACLMCCRIACSENVVE